jgi:hypothetical protein
MPSAVSPAGLPGLRSTGRPVRPRSNRTSSLELAFPFRVHRSPGGRALDGGPKPSRPAHDILSCGFLPFSVFPLRAAAHDDRASRARPAFVSRFSQPHDAFVSAPNLPALFHAGSARGVRPSELSSSRAAVRCLQRQYPLVVRGPIPPPS